MVHVSLWQSLRFGVSLAQMMGGIALFVVGLPRRPHFAGRMTAVLVGTLALVFGVVFSASFLPTAVQDVFAREESYATFVFILFCLILGACTLVVHALYDVPWANAAFCASAGYTVQNAAGALFTTLQLVSPALQSLPVAASFVPEAAVIIGFYLFVWHIFAGPIAEQGLAHIEERRLLMAIVSVGLVVIGFDVVNKELPGFGVPLPFVLALRLVHLISCAFVLAMEYEVLVRKQLELEAATAASLTQARGALYELSRDSVQAINARVHDMRHTVLRTLEASDAEIDRALLAQVAREVSIYDTQVRTGNDALDTVLSEKGLACEREGIELAVIADGSALSFVTDVDLYAFMGSLLDAALCCVRALPKGTGTGRNVSVRIAPELGMVHVHVECPCAAPPEASLLAPARYVADAYGGTFTTREVNGVYHVNVLFG